MVFPILGLFFGLTDRKKAQSPKLDFLVRDTFHHWFFATRNKFDVMQTIRKTYFLNFALDLLAHSIPKWQFSIFISKPWYNMKIYGWIGQTKQKSIQRQKFYVFSYFRPVFGPDRSKNSPISKVRFSCERHFLSLIICNTKEIWLAGNHSKNWFSELCLRFIGS